MKVVNVSKKFKNSQVLNNINLEIDKTGIYAITGESGSGKTTLLNIITGYITDFEGDVLYGDKSIKQVKYENMPYYISTVSQTLSLHENLTVFENLEIVPIKSAHVDVSEILNLLNIDDLKDEFVYLLSGGEKQRVAIARALLSESPILIFDEPTSSLDNKNCELFMNYILEIAKTKTVIIVTHDTRVETHANSVYHLIDGKLNVIKDDSYDILNVENKETKKSFANINKLFFKRTFKSSLSVYLLYFFIMLLFASSFLFINSYRLGMFSAWFANIDNTSINAIIPQIDSPTLEQEKIYWSQDDIDWIKKQENVDDAIAFESSSSFMNDTDGATLEQTYEYKGQTYPIMFNTVDVRKEISDNYGYFNPKVIAGEWPDNDSNDLLVPDMLVYAYDYLPKDVINKNIELDTTDGKKQYTIKGVYELLPSQIHDYIYIYIGDRLDYYDNRYPNEENYDKFLGAYYDGDESKLSYDEYTQIFGIGLPNILVKVNSEKNVAGVQEIIKEKYPWVEFESQYEYKNGILDTKVLILNVIIFSYYLIAILVFMIMNYFLFKNYIISRLKEFNINYSIGYPKKKLVNMLCYEFLIKNLMLLLIIFGSALLIRLIIGKTFLTSSIISLNNIFLILIFIILSNALNIITMYKMVKNDQYRNKKML